MLPGGTGRFVLVDTIPEWKTDFSVASWDARKRASSACTRCLGEAMASTMCLGSALSECSQATQGISMLLTRAGPGLLRAGGLWGDELCSGATERERAGCPV